MGLLNSIGDIVGGQQIAVLIRGIDDLTDPMGKAEKALNKFDKQAKKTKSNTDKTNLSLTNLSKSSKFLIAGLAGLGIGLAVIGAKLLKWGLTTEENKRQLAELGKETSGFRKELHQLIGRELNDYISLLTVATRQLNELKKGTSIVDKEQRMLIDSMKKSYEVLMLSMTPYFSLLSIMGDYAGESERARLKTAGLTDEQIRLKGLELDEKLKDDEKAFDDYTKSVDLAEKSLRDLQSRIKGLVSAKTGDELDLEDEKNVLLQKSNDINQKILEKKAKGASDDDYSLGLLEEQKDRLDAQVDVIDNKIDKINLQNENFQIGVDRKELELSMDNEILTNMDTKLAAFPSLLDFYGTETLRVRGLKDEWVNLNREKEKYAGSQTNKQLSYKDPKSGETIRLGTGHRELTAVENSKVVEWRASRPESQGPAQNDFVMRPGQGAVPFSPDDTLIGVKDTGKLGGSTINITVQGSLIRQHDLINELGRALQMNMSSYIRGV
jgi:hypothetical protein